MKSNAIFDAISPDERPTNGSTSLGQNLRPRHPQDGERVQHTPGQSPDQVTALLIWRDAWESAFAAALRQSPLTQGGARPPFPHGRWTPRTLLAGLAVIVFMSGCRQADGQPAMQTPWSSPAAWPLPGTNDGGSVLSR